MLMKPVNRSNYAKWRGISREYAVNLEYRPKLDKWDVISLQSKYLQRYKWYMYQKTDRFNNMFEAVVFILNHFSGGEVQIQDRYSPEVTVYNQKEIEMMNKAVATITLVYGKDSRFVEDTEIFGYIKRLEDEIKQLNSIENKPKKLAKKIEEIQEDISKLVDVVDGRV